MSQWTPPPEESSRRFADLRVSYDLGTLAPENLKGSPLEAFHAWFAEVEASGLAEPNAMVVATASAAGAPSSRTVLLKEADARGFVFYTNLQSRKSRELIENPNASCVFPWFAIHRQISVVGTAELIDRDEVETYYRSRPRASRLGAWASAQSTVIDGREGLEARYEELLAQYGEHEEIPVPDFWGGWLIRPSAVEFWQGRPSRLHDRLRFRSIAERADLSQAADWVLERLSP